MSNHEECNCEQSLRLKREVEELKAELASTTTTLVVARSDLRCPICLGLPFDDHTGMGCACGADGTTKSGGIVEAFRSVHEAWAHEKVRADAAIDRGNALNAANAALRAELHTRDTAKYEGVWIWDRNYNDLASMSDKMVISITAGSLRALIATQGGKGEPVARCEVCDWPLRERKEDGCVKGNCSFRPDVGSDDHKRIQKRRAELDAAKALEGQAAEDQATAGILCDVCDAAWGDDTRAVTHGYEGVVERVLFLWNYWLRGTSVEPARAPMTRQPEPHRSHLIRNGLHGGNSDPNRCVCAEKETGRYADTPHVHYPEPPYACARGCGCEAYDPAVPPVPTVDEPTLEAQLADARAYRDACQSAASKACREVERLCAAIRTRDTDRYIVEIAARDAAKAPAVDESALPIGYLVIYDIGHRWWTAFRGAGSGRDDCGWRMDYISSRPAAVAACWAHMRAEAGR